MDQWAARRPALMVANSREVRERIRKYYGRDSVMVYPPVEVERFRMGGEGEYLAVERPSPERE